MSLLDLTGVWRPAPLVGGKNWKTVKTVAGKLKPRLGFLCWLTDSPVPRSSLSFLLKPKWSPTGPAPPNNSFYFWVFIWHKKWSAGTKAGPAWTIPWNWFIYFETLVGEYQTALARLNCNSKLISISIAGWRRWEVRRAGEEGKTVRLRRLSETRGWGGLRNSDCAAMHCTVVSQWELPTTSPPPRHHHSAAPRSTSAVHSQCKVRCHHSVTVTAQPPALHRPVSPQQQRAD